MFSENENSILNNWCRFTCRPTLSEAYHGICYRRAISSKIAAHEFEATLISLTIIIALEGFSFIRFSLPLSLFYPISWFLFLFKLKAMAWETEGVMNVYFPTWSSYTNKKIVSLPCGFSFNYILSLETHHRMKSFLYTKLLVCEWIFMCLRAFT